MLNKSSTGKPCVNVQRNRDLYAVFIFFFSSCIHVFTVSNFGSSSAKANGSPVQKIYEIGHNILTSHTIKLCNASFLANIDHFVIVCLSSFYHISRFDSTFPSCQLFLVEGELQNAAERSLPQLLLLHRASVNTPTSLLLHVSPLFRNKHTQTVSIIPVIFASC